MLINSEKEFGDIVYLKTDINQLPRMITKVCADATGVTYELTSGTLTTWHQRFEFTDEKDILLKTES